MVFPTSISSQPSQYVALIFSGLLLRQIGMTYGLVVDVAPLWILGKSAVLSPVDENDASLRVCNALPDLYQLVSTDSATIVISSFSRISMTSGLVAEESAEIPHRSTEDVNSDYCIHLPKDHPASVSWPYIETWFHGQVCGTAFFKLQGLWYLRLATLWQLETPGSAFLRALYKSSNSGALVFRAMSDRITPIASVMVYDTPNLQHQPQQYEDMCCMLLSRFVNVYVDHIVLLTLRQQARRNGQHYRDQLVFQVRSACCEAKKTPPPSSSVSCWLLCRQARASSELIQPSFVTRRSKLGRWIICAAHLPL